MPRPHSPRMSRHDADRIPFTKQLLDERIQEQVDIYRFLTADLIAKILDEPLSTVQHRLQRLFKRGYVKRLLCGSKRLVYAPEWLPRSKQPHVDHDLMASRFWVSLELATRSRPNIGYEWTAGWTLRSQGGKVIPDAELCMFYHTPTGKRGVLNKAEFDRATESPARILEKFQAYIAFWNEQRKSNPHAPPFRTLFVTTTETRVRSLRKGVMTQLGPTAMFLCTYEGAYSPDRPQTILSPIWQTPASDDYLKLLA
jgi:hypothetical protein